MVCENRTRVLDRCRMSCHIAIDRTRSTRCVHTHIPEGEPVSGQHESSPSPSDVGFSIISRRSLIVGAAGVAGAGLIVTACGDDDESSDATSAPAGTDAPAGTEAAAGTD